MRKGEEEKNTVTKLCFLFYSKWYINLFSLLEVVWLTRETLAHFKWCFSFETTLLIGDGVKSWQLVHKERVWPIWIWNNSLEIA